MCCTFPNFPAESKPFKTEVEREKFERHVGVHASK